MSLKRMKMSRFSYSLWLTMMLFKSGGLKYFPPSKPFTLDELDSMSYYYLYTLDKIK